MGIVNNKEQEMSKLLITTQVYENYTCNKDGSFGTGDNAYWKAKGGDEYIVRDIANEEDATIAVMALREKIESDSEGYRETIIDWKLVDNDYLTEFERSQLEYEGKITFPAKELVWA
jgi:hypothetical protein